MTRRRMARRAVSHETGSWDTILGILARCGPHDWTVGRSVCGHMRGAFHVPPPFMLRSPPRYSGARRPVPRVLILDSSLRVGLGRRREAESHLSSSPSWRGTLRLAKPMHRDNLPRREMSHTHTHTGATWTCVPVGVTRGGSHATFASRAAARVGRLRRGALRLAVLGALLLVLWRRARSQGGA